MHRRVTTDLFVLLYSLRIVYASAAYEAGIISKQFLDSIQFFSRKYDRRDTGVGRDKLSEKLTDHMVQYVTMALYQEFSRLFRRYRLRSEFETLSDFSDGLAQEGYYYDESLFSHWQKGNRVPRDRDLVLTLCQLFCKRNAMRTRDEVNQFLTAAGHTHASDTEFARFPVKLIDVSPFLVPKPTPLFTGRVTELTLIRRMVLQYEHILLYGPHGVGKSSLALEVAHQLRASFPDGVFWFDCSATAAHHVLMQICHAYGSGVSAHLSMERLTEVYRSLVWNKQALYIFDHLPGSYDLQAILPNGSHSAVIATATTTRVPAISTSDMMRIAPLSPAESREFLDQCIGSNPDLPVSAQTINQLVQVSQGMPIVLQVMGKQIAFGMANPDDLVTALSNPKAESASAPRSDIIVGLLQFYQQPYDMLSESQRQILQCIYSFAGADVAADALPVVLASRSPSISDQSEQLSASDRSAHSQTRQSYDHDTVSLLQQGFLEQTRPDRLRLPPLIQQLLQNQPSSQDRRDQYIEPIMVYYEKFLSQYQSHPLLYQYMADELESVVGSITRAAQLLASPPQQEQFEKTRSPMPRISTLGAVWKRFRTYYWHVGYWKEFAALATQVLEAATQAHDTLLAVDIELTDLSRLWYYDQDLDKAYSIAETAIGRLKQVTIPPSAKDAQTNQLRKTKAVLNALANQKMGKIRVMQGQTNQGMKLLRKAEAGFVRQKNQMQQSHTLRYLSEGYCAQQEYLRATEFLTQSQQLLDQCSDNAEYPVYQTVLQSHFGVLALLQDNPQEALQRFEAGLAYADDRPLVRGTYTWLSKAGASLAAAGCGNIDTANRYRMETRQQMLLLGITDTYHTINQYAAALQSGIEELLQGV